VASSRHLPAAAKTSPKGKHNPILPYSTLSWYNDLRKTRFAKK
jgi:hypothetical protein